MNSCHLYKQFMISTRKTPSANYILHVFNYSSLFLYKYFKVETTNCKLEMTKPHWHKYGLLDMHSLYPQLVKAGANAFPLSQSVQTSVGLTKYLSLGISFSGTANEPG